MTARFVLAVIVLAIFGCSDDEITSSGSPEISTSVVVSPVEVQTGEDVEVEVSVINKKYSSFSFISPNSCPLAYSVYRIGDNVASYGSIGRCKGIFTSHTMEFGDVFVETFTLSTSDMSPGDYSIAAGLSGGSDKAPWGRVSFTIRQKE